MRNLIRTTIISAVLLGSLMLFQSCANKKSSAVPPAPTSMDPELITIIGDPLVSGVFDPAIEYDDLGNGYMTYSWVDWPQEVVTHLAKSTDNGETWTFLQALNAKSIQNIGGQDFIWKYETSTLLYDPTDVPSKRWKFFVQKAPVLLSTCTSVKCPDVFWGSTLIEYRTASTPEGSWSAPVCLFGKAPGCSVDIDTLDSSLTSNKGYNELGVLVHNGIIYMSMDSYTTDTAIGEWDKRKIILLSSSDHAASWNYVGDLTTFADADAFGYAALTASALVSINGSPHLIVSPSGANSGPNKAHDGGWVIEFEDITTASLKRNAGELVVKTSIPYTGDNGGIADYDEQNTAAGVITGDLNLDLYPGGHWFELHKTFINP